MDVNYTRAGRHPLSTLGTTEGAFYIIFTQKYNPAYARLKLYMPVSLEQNIYLI